jgi:hypothetical protein
VFFEAPPQYYPQQAYAAPQQRQQQRPAATVRGQMPNKEQARPRTVAAAPVAIPTPEQLGIGSARKPNSEQPVQRTASAAVAIPTPEQLGIGATR